MTGEIVERFKERCLDAGEAPATVDRYVEALRAALRFAHEQERISRVPKLSLLRPNNRRTGFFDKAEVEAVCARLREPLADVVRFAYLSGRRRGEIVGLLWSQVDRAAREARLSDSKSGEPRTLPYRESAELTELLERRWMRHAAPAGAEISPLVFHEAGRPVGDFRKAWRSACRRAGVGPRLFHDLRRSAVRDLIRAGAPQTVAMEITGHRSDSVFRRYNISDARDKATALARMESYRAALPGAEDAGVSTEFLQRAARARSSSG